MSDNVRRYAAVRTALIKYHGGAHTKRFARHLTTLAAMVSGLVAAGSAHLSKMAQKAPDRTHAQSRIRRFTRLLKNPRLTPERCYGPFARVLAERLSQHQPLLVIFDGSGLGRGCATLAASAVYGHRALPLAWIVKRGQKGHFSTEDHLDVLDLVERIVPEQAQVIFLGDGEFDSVALQRRLEQIGWCYVCRGASSTLVDDGFTACTLAELTPRAGERYLSMPGASVTQARYGPVHVVVWHEAPHVEPLLLLTNLELAEEACHWYGHRGRVETLFSDQKSRGFHLHKSHISDPERLSRLLIAASLAYVWMIYLGVMALRRAWYKRFHRGDRVDLSLFQLGLCLLEHMLNEGWRILVAFAVPPPGQLQSVR